VIIHPFIFQELYLGRPKGKDFIFERLARLPCLSILSDEEFRYFVDSHKVSGKGIGIVDSHLLGSASRQRSALYTLDRKLERLANSIL
jgi:hypothetical protein